MSALRTLDAVWAAGYADGAADPPLSQELADRIAAILAPYFRARAAREPQAA